MLIHLTAHAVPGQKPLLDPEAAWWLMWHLRLSFPIAVAACLMPDHLHLLTVCADLHLAQTRLARLLGYLAVRAGVRRLFERVPDAQVIVSGRHLERQVRYVHLNPCRAKLASDPLCWPWSTHRGVVGAELDPWVPPERLAEALGRPRRNFEAMFHRYVSGDPSVDIAGSAFPVACSPAEIPAVPLELVRRAALSATPWSPPSERRRMIVALALHQGWTNTESLAGATGLTARAVRAIVQAVRPLAAPQAATLCLGDARLVLPERHIRPVTQLPRTRAADLDQACAETGMCLPPR